MSNRGWHILCEEGGLTLSRLHPPRFDLRAETALPGGAALRLAHQIRQDLWRRLQNLRGFAPVVRLTPQGAGWRVEAGGAALGSVSERHVMRLAELLEDRTCRARWLRCAGYRAGAGE